MYPKSEYRNLSPHYSTNSATPPYISTYGTLNTRLFQNTSHHKPQHNFNTSFPCTTIFSPETKTATINLIRLSEFYLTP